MNSALLISGLVFVLVILLGFLIFYYSDQYKKRKGISERIRKETADVNKEGFSQDGKGRDYFLKMVSGFSKVLSSNKEADISETRKKLLKAGYYHENGVKLFFGSKVCSAFLFLMVFLILNLTVLNTMPKQYFLLCMIFSFAMGFYLPDFYLSQRTRKRKRKIFEGFPDALDLMVVCVEAGMGLDAAIKRVGDEMALKNRILSDEFRILSLELRAGKPRVDALRNLAMRTDLEDVSSLVTLLIQTDKFGTRVAQALRVHSDSMRTKRYQRAEEIAAKLPVKIVFPLVLFIFPALFVPIVGPAIIRIYRVLILR